jgi:hypothetical protein
MKIFKFFIAILSLLVLSNSCKKTDSFAGIAIQDYPIAVGNKWIYKVVDNTFRVTDTMTISVVSQSNYSNDSIVYYTKTTIKNVAVDSGLIIKSSNGYTYAYSNPIFCLFSDIHLSFPITNHATWEGQNSTDILQIDTMNYSSTILGNTYTNLCVLNRHESSPSSIHQITQISPGIGVVYQSLFQSSSGTPNKSQSLFLISYELY